MKIVFTSYSSTPSAVLLFYFLIDITSLDIMKFTNIDSRFSHRDIMGERSSRIPKSYLSISFKTTFQLIHF